MEEKITRTVKIENSELTASIFGSYDVNVRMLERHSGFPPAKKQNASFHNRRMKQQKLTYRKSAESRTFFKGFFGLELYEIGIFPKPLTEQGGIFHCSGIYDFSTGTSPWRILFRV